MIFAGVAVTVGVSMYVLSISRLSEVDMVIILPKYQCIPFYSYYHPTYYPLKTDFLLALIWQFTYHYSAILLAFSLYFMMIEYNDHTHIYLLYSY